MEADLDLILDGKVARPKTASPAPRGVLEVANQYYVLASSVARDRDTRVLKQGETFAVFDSYGDVRPITHDEAGIYHRGTRYVSRFEIGFCGPERPLLLNSTLRDDNGLLKIDMTNRDQTLEDGGFLPKGSLHIHREKFVVDALCLEKMEITNYSGRRVDAQLFLHLGCDFSDLFEARGLHRERRGHLRPPERSGSLVTFAYRGLDEIERRTRLAVSGSDFSYDGDQLTFELRLEPRAKVEIEFAIEMSEASASSRAPGESPRASSSHAEGLAKIAADHAAGWKKYCGVRSSNEAFEEWLRRSTDDLVMMTTPTIEGELYPYAGIPWFCAAFGRDGILTAIECLWANPSLARGVLKFLAATQAKAADPARDATPGKIIHEVRFGEMANLGEIPFGRYYGSIDSTPLFLALAGLYYSRTADLETVREIRPALELALEWLDRFGDPDGDGFVEYRRESPKGLVQQGWKDSTDSIFHEDGSEAKGPIALAEVQGYVYLARRESAKLFATLGEAERAQNEEKRADALKEKFDREFWQEDLGTYALALDGAKRPCRVRASNAGQCLFTGIVKRERAAALVRSLMGPAGFSGWGIRTVSTEAARYNPMSYHNGSVWPHDVALVAWGLSKYGFQDEVERVFNGLFRAAQYMELMRMPEVFCGFQRREGEAPTLYPHACSPQAWSAAAVYMMLQALLGLEIDAVKNEVHLTRPRLPEAIETLRISGLEIGPRAIDLVAQNFFSDVSVQIPKRSDGITLIVEK